MTKTMSRAEKAVQRHILKRFHQALGDRSVNWLAQQSGVPQSTLATQCKAPNFSLETLIHIAPVLKRTIAWFLPDTPEAEVEAEAFRRIVEIVEEAQAERQHS